MIALVSATLLTGRPPTGEEHRAAGLLGTEGSRTRLVNAGDHRMVLAEWSRGLGMQVFESGPESYVMASPDLEELNRTDWARLSLVWVGEAGAVLDRTDTLFAVTSAGVETRVQASGDRFRSYRPAELALPASVSAGATWHSAGTVVDGTGLTPADSRPYRLEASATDSPNPSGAPAHCLDVTYHEVVGTTEETTQTITWCPGAGVAGLSTTQGRFVPAAVAPAWSAGSPATAASATWGDPASWTSADVDFARKPPMFLTPRTPPGLLPGARVVFANEAGRDLVAVDADDPSPNAAWRAHPGGDITTMATFGSITMAATTTRRLVAYGSDGQFRWETALPEVSQVALTALDDRTAAVACVDGTVLLVDIPSGQVSGTFATSGEYRVDPVPAGDRLYLIDQGGRLAALGPGAEPAWEADAQPAQLLAADARHVVIADSGDNNVSAFSAADGRPLWTRTVPFSKRALAVQGDLVLIRSNASIIALNSDTGEPAWTAPHTTYQWLPGPTQTVLVESGRLVVLDANGTIVRTIPSQLRTLDSGTVWVSRGNGRFAVFLGALATVVGTP